jgi:hypothetical protein
MSLSTSTNDVLAMNVWMYKRWGCALDIVDGAMVLFSRIEDVSGL